MAPDCGDPGLEGWPAHVCQCLGMDEPRFWFWGSRFAHCDRLCRGSALLAVGSTSSGPGPPACSEGGGRLLSPRRVPFSQGLKAGQGVSQKHLVLPCPGGPRGQLVV